MAPHNQRGATSPYSTSLPCRRSYATSMIFRACTAPFLCQANWMCGTWRLMEGARTLTSSSLTKASEALPRACAGSIFAACLRAPANTFSAGCSVYLHNMLYHWLVCLQRRSDLCGRFSRQKVSPRRDSHPSRIYLRQPDVGNGRRCSGRGAEALAPSGQSCWFGPPPAAG